MRSRILRPTILALLVLLLIAGSAPILAGADTPEQRASSGPSDLVAFGTSWVPQLRGAFGNKWITYGWGVEAKVKPARAPGYQWVHIPIPYMSVEEGTAVKLDLVQFCAKSSNGAATKPTDVHVWVDSNTHATRIATQAITWASNNDKQCVTVNLADTWYASVGLSVALYFANANDTITLYKAWARVVP